MLFGVPPLPVEPLLDVAGVDGVVGVAGVVSCVEDSGTVVLSVTDESVVEDSVDEFLVVEVEDSGTVDSSVVDEDPGVTTALELELEDCADEDEFSVVED